MARCSGFPNRKSGLRQELNPTPNWDVWEMVNAEGSACNRKNCSPDTCHYQRARAEMRKAQVVIVNHSLLFALLNAGGLSPNAKGILLPDDFLVIDEAHTTAEVATEHFGARISSYGLDRQLKALFNPKRKSGIVRKFAHTKQLQAIQKVGQKTFTVVCLIYKRLPYAHDDTNPYGDDTVSFKTTAVKVKGWLVPMNTAECLDDATLQRLHDKAVQLGMTPLVEIYEPGNAARVLRIGARLIGVNNRDLRTFETDLQHTVRMRQQIPEGHVLVGESGIHSRADVQLLEAAGVHAILVGEHLMASLDIGAAVDRLLG